MLKIAFLSGLLFLLALACLAGFLWTIYCYNATYRCRLRILECVREGNRARFADGEMSGILYEAFLAVPHEAHLWKVMTFRDPLQLYPAEIRALIDRCTAKSH